MSKYSTICVRVHDKKYVSLMNTALCMTLWSSRQEEFRDFIDVFITYNTEDEDGSTVAEFVDEWKSFGQHVNIKVEVMS